LYLWSYTRLSILYKIIINIHIHTRTWHPYNIKNFPGYLIVRKRNAKKGVIDLKIFRITEFSSSIFAQNSWQNELNKCLHNPITDPYQITSFSVTLKDYHQVYECVGVRVCVCVLCGIYKFCHNSEQTHTTKLTVNNTTGGSIICFILQAVVFISMFLHSGFKTHSNVKHTTYN
jgi:hypothetical protein